MRDEPSCHPCPDYVMVRSPEKLGLSSDAKGVLTVFVLGVELKTPNESLRGVSRKAMYAKARRVRNQRGSVTLMLRSRLGTKGPALPIVVTITRVSPRPLDDDNLVGSAKHVRDSVAKWCGVDDRDRRYTWLYHQRSEGCLVGVEIRIEPTTHERP